MKLIVKILSLLIVYIVLKGIVMLCNKPGKFKKGKVYLSKGIGILGVIVTLFFLTLTLITVFSDEPIWVPVLFFVLSLFGGAIIVAYINCRITYDEKGFVVKNFFGLKRSYKYSQVTGFRADVNDICIFTDKRTIKIDTMSVGVSLFISFVHEEYMKLYKRKLPYIERSKNDLFNGHIRSPGEFIFVYVTLALVALVFLGIVVWIVYWPPSVNNTIEKHTAFSTYTVYEDDIVLNSVDNQVYKISIPEDRIDASRIKELCDGKTMVTVYCKEVTPENEVKYFNIKAFLYNGEYVLTFEQYYEFQIQGGWKPVVIILFFDLLIAFFIVGSIIVGRNPQKYGRRIVRLFFKESYVSY